MAKPLFVETDFRPGDKVQWGPHEAHVQSITISSSGLSYTVSYWIEDEQLLNSAADWELKLIEPLQV